MRWGDERYVRVYTRDTVTWKMAPWQGRAVLPSIMRKLDRAGVMDLGDERPEEAIAAMVDLPLEVVEKGLPYWLTKGTFQIVAGKLVMPNFLEAQEASQTDAQRMRESRARARDRAMAEKDGIDVTKANGTDTSVHVTNGIVTSGHNQSLLAVPSLPSSTEPTKNQIPASPVPDSGESSISASFGPLVRDVFNYWASKQAHLTRSPVDRLKLTGDRRSKIQGRLRDKYTVDDLKRAIDGVFATSFNTENGHTDVSLVCRDGAHVDRYMAAGKTNGAHDPAAGYDRIIRGGKDVTSG